MSRRVSSLIDDTIEENRYLLFKLGGNTYGTPLLTVREVVEATRPQSIPEAERDFLGVIEIRGQVVGVVDLRLKFNHTPDNNQHSALLVFDTEMGPKAALVDKVESVQRITAAHIDSSPNINTTVPKQFIKGVARLNGQLVTLLDLAGCINNSNNIQGN